MDYYRPIGVCDSFHLNDEYNTCPMYDVVNHMSCSVSGCQNIDLVILCCLLFCLDLNRIYTGHSFLKWIRVASTLNFYQSKKLQEFTKLCKGDMSQNSKTAKNGFEAILSRVDFQDASYVLVVVVVVKTNRL